MPYGFRVIKKGADKQVICTTIYYGCNDCKFVTTNQDDERKHHTKLNHNTYSKMNHDSPEPYNEKIHGPLPWQTKRQLEL